jgi:hypothetical protein
MPDIVMFKGSRSKSTLINGLANSANFESAVFLTALIIESVVSVTAIKQIRSCHLKRNTSAKSVYLEYKYLSQNYRMQGPNFLEPTVKLNQRWWCSRGQKEQEQTKIISCTFNSPKS